MTMLFLNFHHGNPLGLCLNFSLKQLYPLPYEPAGEGQEDEAYKHSQDPQSQRHPDRLADSVLTKRPSVPQQALAGGLPIYCHTLPMVLTQLLVTVLGGQTGGVHSVAILQ